MTTPPNTSHDDLDELREEVISVIDDIFGGMDGTRLEHEYLVLRINQVFDNAYVETVSQTVHVIK